MTICQEKANSNSSMAAGLAGTMMAHHVKRKNLHVPYCNAADGWGVAQNALKITCKGRMSMCKFAFFRTFLTGVEACGAESAPATRRRRGESIALPR